MGGLNLTARSEENKQDSENNNSSEDSSDSSDTSNRNSSSQNFENSSNQNVQITPDNLIAGSSSIVGKRGNENLGLAVFNKDKYCGQLTATETICHLLIANEINTCIFTISNPFNENDSIEVQIIPEKKSKISSNYDNDNFKFVIYEDASHFKHIINGALSDMVDNLSGIWVGSDFDMQEVFDSNKTYEDVSLSNDSLVIIDDSIPKFVKYPTLK